MASAKFLVCRGLRDPDRRLGVALLASVLLHVVMLASLSRYAVHGHAFFRPVHVPLSVRIEKVVTKSPEAVPIVMEGKKASFHQKVAVVDPVTTIPPAEIQAPLSEPGVSVSEVLYGRPISSRVSSPLLATGEYRRTSDISDKPEAVAISVPQYPRPASDQKLSGWVILMLFVDEAGKVVDSVAVESSEAFTAYEKDVANGLRGSTFTPGKLNGLAVKTQIFEKVLFDSKALSGLESLTRPGAPVTVEDGTER